MEVFALEYFAAAPPQNPNYQPQVCNPQQQQQLPPFGNEVNYDRNRACVNEFWNMSFSFQFLIGYKKLI